MPQPSTIFLATSCYGGLAHANYLRALLDLRPACAARGVSLEIALGGESLIGRSRAALMARFLASHASHLLFVDADVGFQPDHVFRLLDAGFDVAGGVYPRKQLDLARGAQAPDLELDLLPDPQPEARGGFRQVAALGAGFLMISRRAAQRMHDGYPALHARLDDVTNAGVATAAMVFESFADPDTGRYLADHQAFCRRWRDLGGEVWADLGPGLTHVGAVLLATAQA